MDACDIYRTQVRYNRWFNARLYEVAAGLTEDERRRELGAYFGSVHRTLNHLILCDCVWLHRCAPGLGEAVPRGADGQELKPAGLDSVLYEDFDLLKRRRTALDAAMQQWVDALSTDDLEREISYRTTKGIAQRHPMWWALTHLFNHQTHHRGQVHAALTRLGVAEPPSLDLLIMQREAAAGG
jgi:uncharacterized damage-inducible protein DinB